MPRLLLVLGWAAGVGLVPPADGRDRKPNVLVIFSDDHGWADLGIQGVDGDVRTPNLDQLAKDGVRFARGYVTAPQCTPSRAGLISGRYQNRFGVEHNGLAMPAEVVTLPERLRAAGYVTGMSGKWHLDVENPDKSEPKQHRVRPDLAPGRQGFDEYFNGSLQDYSASHGLDGAAFADAPREVRDRRCRVVVQTEAALAFLKRREANPDQPWFHYLAYLAPHVPLESPEPWFSRTPAHLPRERRQALALIAAIDDGVGRIRAKLRGMGQEEDTLIFFIGDNGAPLGSAWDGSLNRPLRGQKGMLSEGGIRVPFLAAWPGTIPGGQTYPHPVISLDVAATAIPLAGLEPDATLDGVNLLPFLTGEADGPPHVTLTWRWMSQAAILEFPHKLIALGGRAPLLFDVADPAGEAVGRNLAATRPEIAERLEAKLRAWTGTLQPPGMPPPLADRHVQLFAEHGISAEAPQTGAPAAGGGEAVRGWLGRNGRLSIRDGALILTPDEGLPRNARPFLTVSALDLPGPIQATLRLRASRGGPATWTWRTRRQPDFLPENLAAFDWPASEDWSEVSLPLPVEDRVIHLRLNPPRDAAGIAIQSIELKGPGGASRIWHFDEPAPKP